MNEDSHTNNIAVLYDTEKDCYELSPIFDQGLSLLADTSYDFSLEQPLEDCIKRVEAKPFHSSFVQQVDAAEELYEKLPLLGGLMRVLKRAGGAGR